MISFGGYHHLMDGFSYVFFLGGGGSSSKVVGLTSTCAKHAPEATPWEQHAEQLLQNLHDTIIVAHV